MCSTFPSCRLILTIVQTPNRILDSDDVPDRIERTLGPNVSYPAESRFTRHSFVPSSRNISNVDAAFRNSYDGGLPSMTLLQYHYGACALKTWGRNLDAVDSSKLHRVTVEVEQSHTKRRKTSGIKYQTTEEPPRSMDDLVLFLSSSSDAARVW